MPDSSRPADKPRRGVNGGEAILGDGRTVALADLSDRVAARFLDPVVACLFGLGTFIIVVFDGFLRSFGASFGPPSGDYLAGVHEEVQTVSLTVSLVVFGIIVVYEMARIGSSGQTWGKRRRRVRVVTRRDGATPSPEMALVRGLVPAAAGAGGSIAAALADIRVPAVGGLVVWFVVYLSAMWGKSGRGWHDQAAGTVVIADPQHEAQPDKLTRPAPGPSGGEAAPRRGSGQSGGLVSDYYGPRHPRHTEERLPGTEP